MSVPRLSRTHTTIAMVCERCEEKLSKLVVPDKWSDSKESASGVGGGGKDGSRTRRLKKRAERYRRNAIQKLRWWCS